MKPIKLIDYKDEIRPWGRIRKYNIIGMNLEQIYAIENSERIPRSSSDIYYQEKGRTNFFYGDKRYVLNKGEVAAKYPGEIEIEVEKDGVLWIIAQEIFREPIPIPISVPTKLLKPLTPPI